MSLPASFKTAEDYFEASIKFFKQFQILCNFPNTEVLVNNVLDQICIENLENINILDKDLKNLATGNSFIDDFVRQATKIRYRYDEHEVDPGLESYVKEAPLGPKKRHEILYLAKEIKSLCDRVGCDTVVDFGSGLGYLDQRIFDTTSFKVLGIECNDGHFATAKRRQRMYHSASKGHVTYVKHRVTADSHTNIHAYLRDKFGKAEFCITGLHSCADLTIDALNVFLKMEDAKALVLMPCCYHKMEQTNGRFTNFPLSRSMRKFYEELEGWEFMSVPFLRLGAQPRSAADTLDDLVFNLLARSALQLFAHTHNCQIKRNKRKAVKTKAMENNFENYIQNASQGFTLTKNNPSGAKDIVQFDMDELRLIWKQITNSLTVKKAGIFICLQNYTQELVENLILFDRLMFLRENGIENCGYKKIVNDRISPRALALVAHK